MSSKPSSRPPLTDFVRPLLALLSLTQVACAGTVTPPDSTPVYAEDIGKGLEPVDVEHQSTNRPDPETASTEGEKSDVATPQEQPTATSPDAPDAKKASAEAPDVPNPNPQAEP